MTSRATIPVDAGAAAPRLRFDKVAVRLVRSVCSALEPAVPEGLCVAFAVSAPIREPSKTTKALCATIRAQLASGAVPGTVAQTIHGNAIQARLMTKRSAHPTRIFGFIHNHDPAPDALFDMAQRLLNGAQSPEAASGGARRDAATLQTICEKLLSNAR
ncbi:MAG TPA: hypothetical protein VG248_11480 [Caulobacteraceae bacterium]|nr:hypothetical protein [Caulobacteraceae bacterium]